MPRLGGPFAARRAGRREPFGSAVRSRAKAVGTTAGKIHRGAARRTVFAPAEKILTEGAAGGRANLPRGLVQRVYVLRNLSGVVRRKASDRAGKIRILGAGAGR